MESIKSALLSLKDLLTFVESGYVEYLQKLSDDDLHTEIGSRVADTIHEIAESEEFSGTIATTNAVAFDVDEYQIEAIDFVDGECNVRLTYAASGEQLEDKFYYGDRVTGDCEAVFDSEGRVEYRDIHAEVYHEAEDEAEYDPGLDDG